MNRKRGYWIAGAATAFLGVGLVRLLAPELSGNAGMLAMAAGYTLVVVGITIISLAMRRKPEDAFVTVDNPPKSRKSS